MIISLPTTKAIFERVVTQIGVLPLHELLPALLGEVAVKLAVERVSYFRMVEDGQALELEAQFLLSSRRGDDPPTRLQAADYPGYFAALHEPDNLIISHDVMHDPRLVELRENYFQQLGIRSMLDVPARRSGRLFGVICLEHVGPLRRWTGEEVELARSLGHWVALAVETQDRKELAEELRLALGRERELVEVKTSFVNLVSHEFRTPLGIIHSATDILRNYFDRLGPEQRNDQLHDIRHATRQMSNLMEEVLTVGKVESGHMSCRKAPFELEDFCTRIADEQATSTNRKCPIALEFEGLGGLAHGDEGLLRHILGNLISNAVKYSRSGQEVRFAVRREGSFAEFEITDQGIGIDPADHRHLFIAFFRGRNVASYPGTGLGLVIVKRCVALHGGSLRFDSQLGEGTRFTIRLELFETTMAGRSSDPIHKTKSLSS